jgi:uncharacterized protein YggE
MKTYLLLIALLLVGCQTKQADYVVVRGFATVTVPVDYVNISVAVTTSGEALNLAYQHNQALIAKVLDVMRSYSIPDSDFVTIKSDTKDANAETRFAFGRSQKPAFVATYEARLTLRSIARYDEIVRALLTVGNLEIALLSFHSNDIDRYQKQAYAKALLNAREHAEQMVAGSQRRLGKLMKLLQEGRDDFTRYDNIEEPESIQFPQEARISGPMVMEAKPKGPVTFKRKNFDQNASVTAIFALE